MKPSKLIGLFVIVALMGLAEPGPAGAAPPAPRQPGLDKISDVRRGAREIGRALEKISEAVTDYGSIHVSPPLLAEPGTHFRFDLNLGATNYFESAKREIDADASYFEQAVQSFGFAASAQWDPTVAAGGAERVREYFDVQARRRLKQGLVDDALERQLQADVAAAEAVTDPVERLKALAAARDRYATNYVAAAEAPTFPTAAGDSLPGSAAGLAKRPTDLVETYAEPKFRNFQGLFGEKTPKPTLSNRAALGRAAGDVATEAIFRVLGQPEKATAFTGQKVIFGVVEVTVNPGRKTQEGYLADVSVLAEYHFAPARPEVVHRFLKDEKVPLVLRRRLAIDRGEELASQELKTALEANGGLKFLQEELGDVCPQIPSWLRVDENSEHSVPTIFAVSPFSDLESMDQSSSMRRQTELALSLSFAFRSFGMSGVADSFEKFVRSRQLDARSRVSFSPVTSYAQGGMVGFQVGPRLQPTGSLGRKNRNAPEMKLGRQAFPALLVFGVDPAYLYPRVQCVDGRLSLVEANVRLTQVPIWRPLNGGSCFSGGGSTLEEDKKLLLSVELRHAKARNEAMWDQESLAGLKRTLEAREKALKSQFFGSYNQIPVLAPSATVPLEAAPVPSWPEVGECMPSQFTWAGRGPQIVRLAILGRKLGLVRLAGVREMDNRAVVKKVDRIGDALLLEVEVTGPGTLIFDLPVDTDEGRLASDLVLRSKRVVIQGTDNCPEACPPVPVLKTREIRSAVPGGVEHVIELAPNASDSLLGLAREIHRVEFGSGSSTNAASRKVEVNVEANVQTQRP